MRRNKGKEPSSYYQRLDGNSVEARAAPKGHVPVLVGRGSSAERFLVNVKLFNDPCMVALLEMAAAELGDSREGVLRITCDADHFRRVVSVISKANR